MRNTKKKGFTIVELVIVVAVIAILSSVLIPTVAGLIEKANLSRDAQLVRQLNTALATDLDGKNETMYDAVQATKEYGFDVAKLSAKSKNGKILWDSVNDLFCYYTEEKGYDYLGSVPAEVQENAVNFWEATDDLESPYSIYYTGSETNVEVSRGFDAGESGVVNVTYINNTAQNAIIRTNNEFGKLTINAPNDEIAHYGAIGDLDIIAVKMGSYNENGDVNGVATLTYGKINVGSEGKIAVIIANPVNAADVKLDVASGGQVGSLFAKDDAIVSELNVEGVKNAEVVEEGVIDELKNKVCYVKNGSQAKYYDDIQTAINEANGATTIVVMKSVLFDNVTNSKFTIGAGKNITLDLNGNVIEARLDNTKTVNLIKVKGSTSGADVYGQLTVKDSTAGSDGVGKGEIRTTELYNSDPMNVSASVISVERNGKVVIESGKIVNNNTNCAWGAYAIDVLTNTGAQNAWLTVNGGLVESVTYRAIRAFCNSKTGKVYITVNGGTVRSGNNNAIWLQSPSDKDAGLGLLKITGGTIESNGYYNGAERFALNFSGNNKAGLSKSITGGKFIQNGKDVTAGKYDNL